MSTDSSSLPKIDMRTRKIRLSPKLTLSFRETSPVSVAKAVTNELNKEPGHDAFDNLPDLLPEVFQSQTDGPTSDIKYAIGDSSIYQIWDASTELLSLAAHDGREKSISPPVTLASDGSVDSEVTHSNFLRPLEFDHSITTMKIPLRENVRRVQAYSPQESTMEIERELELDSLPITTKDSLRENLRSIQVDALLEIMEEVERKHDPFEFETYGNDTYVDSYLLLQENALDESSSEHPLAGDSSTHSTLITELRDILQVPTGKLRGIKKSIRKRKASYQKENRFDTNITSEIKKQKRSAVRRRGPAVFSNQLDQKLKWLSDPDCIQAEFDEGRHDATFTIDKESEGIRDLRRRKTVSLVKILPSSPPIMPTAESEPNFLPFDSDTKPAQSGRARLSG